MTDDAELLRRYAEEGSEDAFGEVVRRRVDLVYGAAWRGVAAGAGEGGSERGEGKSGSAHETHQTH